MKKIISALFLCMLLSAVPELQAQNIQLHYDFGRSLYDKDLKGRPLLTSTVEKFHPDNWGSTYFFIDMDYTSEGFFISFVFGLIRNSPAPSVATQMRVGDC